MTSFRARRLRAASAALIALAATAALAGCVPEPGPTPAPSATTASPAGTPTPAPAPTPTPTETPRPSPTPTQLSNAECLIGEWEMGQDALTAYYAQINEQQAGAGVNFAPVGHANLHMGEDGTYSWMPAATVTAEVAGATVIVTLGGSVDGAYTADESTISVSGTDSSNLLVSATVNDEPTDAGSYIEQFAHAPVNGASYVCSDSSLQLSSTVAGGSIVTTLARLSAG